VQSDYITGLIANIAADMTTQTTMDFLRATAKGDPWPPEEDHADQDEAEDDIGEVADSEDNLVLSQTENQPEGETGPQQEETTPGETPGDENNVKEMETEVDDSGDKNEVDVSDSEENNQSKEK
jgi:hypothetical protein